MTLETTFQRILDHTNGGKNCPAHEDKNPSLSVTLKTDKRKILIKCHAGCSFDSILSALNLNASDLFEKSENNPKSGRREVARYRYEDEDNKHLFDVVRFEPKDFRQQAADGTWNTQNVKKVPFDLPLIKASIQSGKTLLMLEGEKDCLKAEEMGYPATTLPGGAGKWREEYLQYFNDADLVLIPDLDQSGIRGMTRIAEALYGTVKRLRWIKLPGLGDVKTKHGKDFFDWCNLDNSTPEKLKEIIAKSPDWIPPKQIKSKKTFFYEGGQFVVSDDAVIYYPQPKVDKEGNEEPPVPCWICSKLEIESATRDSESEAWGRFLVWKDQDGVEHRWSAPVELLEGDGIDLRRYLAHKGLKISPNKKAKESLLAYIKFWPTEERSRCVNRLGWHGGIYMTHEKAIGANQSEQMVFQSDSILRPSSACAGTLEDWKRTIAAWSSGNSRVLFSISCAAAGPLLELAGVEGGGFHLRGPSSCGKTTLLHAAASFYGPPGDVVRSWRSTSNALEGLAALHNDSTLLLDELSQMASGDAAEASYMLANGAGKSRANQKGAAKRALSWRLLFLSSGEEGLAALMNQKNKRTNPGAELRMLEIPAEAGRNLGVFEQLHGHESGATLALLFKDKGRLFYGNAGEEWLSKVVENRLSIAEQLPKLINEFTTKFVPSNSSGQVERAARRFGLVAVAGELMSVFGITGWSEGEAENAAATCFRDWMVEYGEGQREDNNVLRQVKFFLEQHGDSRFEPLEKNDDLRPVNNRAGFWQIHEGEREFLVLPEVFREEICKGINYKQAAKVLKDVGWLKTGTEPGRNTKKSRLPGIGLTYCYVLGSSVWGDND